MTLAATLTRLRGQPAMSPLDEDFIEQLLTPEGLAKFKRECFAQARLDAPDMTEQQLEAHWAFTCLQLGLDASIPPAEPAAGPREVTGASDNFLPMDFHDNLDDEGRYIGEPFVPESEQRPPSKK